MTAFGERARRTDQVKRVLLAEDDARIARELTRIVELAGARAVVARTRPALRRAIAECMPFDLVISEAVMPWISGLAVVHACLFEAPTPVAFVVPRDLGPLDRFEQPLVRVIRKPFIDGECAAIVAELLRAATSAG